MCVIGFHSLNKYFSTLRGRHSSRLGNTEKNKTNSCLLEYASSGHFFLVYYFFSRLPGAVIDSSEL